MAVRTCVVLTLTLWAGAAVAREPWTTTAVASSAGAPHVLLVYDMEGLSGQDDPFTAEGLHPAYAKGRRLLTDDVNAVIAGLFSGGARAVSVVDGHGGGNLQDDILRDEVDSRAKLILEPLDGFRDLAKPGMFDGIAVVGMHAKSGSGGFYAHTWTLGIDIAMNGRSLNETQLLGLAYGEAGIPIIFASGDDVLGRELRSMPWVEYVTVKEATGASSAKLYPVIQMHQKLKAGAMRAMQRMGSARILQISTPVEVAIAASAPADLRWIEGMPGVAYRDQTVYFTAPDFKTAYRGIRPVGTAAYQAFFNTTMTAVKAHKDGQAIELQGVEALFRIWDQQETLRAANK